MRTAFAVTVGIAGTVIAAAPAHADDSAPVVIKHEPGIATVTIPNPNLKKKPETTAEPAFQTQSDIYCNLHGPCNFNAYALKVKGITPPGGSYGELRSEGGAYVDVYVVWEVAYTKADFYNTNSFSQWGGISPWYCTSVTHTDVWDIGYWAVSWSFGGTPSGTLNLGSGRLSYSGGSVPNTYRVDNHVDHMWLSVSGGSITDVQYEVHGSYQFGSTFFTSDGYSDYDIH